MSDNSNSDKYIVYNKIPTNYDKTGNFVGGMFTKDFIKQVGGLGVLIHYGTKILLASARPSVMWSVKLGLIVAMVLIDLILSTRFGYHIIDFVIVIYNFAITKKEYRFKPGGYQEE